MYPASNTPRWSIPGVGLLRPRIDRVLIVSSMSVGRLRASLPIAAAKEASHHFEVETYRGEDLRMQSTVVLTCAPNLDPLPMLIAHDISRWTHSVLEVEIAYDVVVGSIDEARSRLFALVGLLGKRWHRRGCLRSVHDADQTPPAGCVSEPTFYLEDRKSGVNMKCYIRHEKLAGGGFGDLVVRLEWTLKGKPALDRGRYLGGNQIHDLLNADLNDFLARNIRLEQVDYVALGNLFRGLKITAPRDRPPRHEHRSVREQWRDPDYRAERAAFLVLRRLAYQEYDELADRRHNKFGDSEQALWVCQNSPAQIRGYCRQLRDGKRPSRRGRPRGHALQRRLPVTDHRINACFRKVELIEAPLPV